MIPKLRSLVYLFLILILPLVSLKGFIVVDFEEISGEKIRAVALNAKTQHLLLYKEIGKNFEENFNGYTLTLNSLSNEKTVANQKQKQRFSSKEPMIIRSKSKISIISPDCKGWKHITLASYNIYFSDDIIVKTPVRLLIFYPS